MPLDGGSRGSENVDYGLSGETKFQKMKIQINILCPFWDFFVRLFLGWLLGFFLSGLQNRCGGLGSRVSYKAYYQNKQWCVFHVTYV
jgi:hypothetical protein